MTRGRKAGLKSQELDKTWKAFIYKLFEINWLYLVLFLTLPDLDESRFKKYPAWVQQIPHPQTVLTFRMLRIGVLNLVTVENKSIEMFFKQVLANLIRPFFYKSSEFWATQASKRKAISTPNTPRVRLIENSCG